MVQLLANIVFVLASLLAVLGASLVFAFIATEPRA